MEDHPEAMVFGPSYDRPARSSRVRSFVSSLMATWLLAVSSGLMSLFPPKETAVSATPLWRTCVRCSLSGATAGPCQL